MDVVVGYRKDEDRSGAGRVYSSIAGVEQMVKSAEIGILWMVAWYPRMAEVKPHIETMWPTLWPTCLYRLCTLTFSLFLKAMKKRKKLAPEMMYCAFLIV
jgi:hypothetical protein